MRDIVLRNLSHNAHPTEPQTDPDHREWWIEQIIELAHSADEPHWLNLIRDWLRPDLCASELAEKIFELLDLADEIACQATRSERFYAAVDEYAGLLTALATPPKPPTFDDTTREALALPNGHGLTLVKR